MGEAAFTESPTNPQSSKSQRENSGFVRDTSNWCEYNAARCVVLVALFAMMALGVREETMMESECKNSIQPQDIEKIFDGVSVSERILSEARQTPEWLALEELRRVVRYDAASAIHGVDGVALFDAITRQIDSQSSRHEVPSAPSVLSASVASPVRTSRRPWIVRWLPALVGAALFVLSLPGLVQLIWGSGSAPVQQPQTVVYINDSGAAGYAKTQAAPDWYRKGEPQPVAVRRNTPDTQLTIEELDFALKRLVERIEGLEAANRHNLETGRSSLDTDSDIPPNKM